MKLHGEDSLVKSNSSGPLTDLLTSPILIQLLATPIDLCKDKH